MVATQLLKEEVRDQSTDPDSATRHPRLSGPTFRPEHKKATHDKRPRVFTGNQIIGRLLK